MIDFSRITLFCLEKRFSKHKMTVFSKNLGGHGPFRHHLATSMTTSGVTDKGGRGRAAPLGKLNRKSEPP